MLLLKGIATLWLVIVFGYYFPVVFSAILWFLAAAFVAYIAVSGFFYWYNSL